jgi:peptide/nickel transport system permease protein
VWGAFTASFIILYLLPGDSVSTLVSGDGGLYVNPEDEDALRETLNLNESFFGQYVAQLGAYLRLDFGTSVRYGAPVIDLIRDAIPPTIVLTISAMVLAIVFGIGLALIATYGRLPRLARGIRLLPALGSSFPTFWVGLVLLQLFSFRWSIFPAYGDDPWYAVVLPAVTIAIAYSSTIAQVTIDGIDKTRAQLYVRTAVSKGVSERSVHVRHVLPSALLPTVSVIGVNFGALLAGAVISEAVFSRSGLGSLMQTAVLQRDLALVQGVIVVIAVIYVVVNFATDSIYPLIDPRVRRPA